MKKVAVIDIGFAIYPGRVPKQVANVCPVWRCVYSA